MEKLKIIKKDGNEYKFIDENDNEYEFVIIFYDIDFEPEVGDFIEFNEDLLDETYDGYSLFYTFGSIDSVYGKENIDKNDTDIIVLITKEKNTFMKRLYG